jgi:hypothetical protein
MIPFIPLNADAVAETEKSPKDTEIEDCLALYRFNDLTLAMRSNYSKSGTMKMLLKSTSNYLSVNC